MSSVSRVPCEEFLWLIRYLKQPASASPGLFADTEFSK